MPYNILMKNNLLPYPCEKVLELVASDSNRVDQLEALEKFYKKMGISSEMYYTHHLEIDYATLVVFLPKDVHVETSDFDIKAFKDWHPPKEKLKL